MESLIKWLYELQSAAVYLARIVGVHDVALVTQEHHVFHGTIAENVGLGRNDATDDEVLAALTAVGAGGWVTRQPDGPHTPVGSGQLQLTVVLDGQIAELGTHDKLLADGGEYARLRAAWQDGG